MPDKKKKRDPLIHDQAVPGAIAAPLPASTGDGDGSNHDYTKTGEPPPPFASTPNKPLYPDMPQWQTPIMLIRGRQGKVSAKNLPGLIDEDKPKPTHKHKAKGKPAPKKKKQKSASKTIQAKNAKEAAEKLHKLLIDAFKQHLRKQLEKNSIQQAVKPVIKNDNASDNLNANSFLAPNNTNIPESTAHKIPTAYDIAEEENKRQRFIEMLQQLSGDQSDADKFSILSDPNKLHIEIDPNLKAVLDSAHIEPPTDIIEVDAYGTGHIGPAEQVHRIVDAINTQYSNETADLLKSGPFGAYGYLVGGDAGARKWSAIDGLMQGADAVGHTQEARNNVENMYAAEPTVPYTDQPANHTATVQTPTTDNTPSKTNEPITITTTSDASAEPILITPSATVNEEVQAEKINIIENTTQPSIEKPIYTTGSSFEKRHIAAKVSMSSQPKEKNTVGLPGVEVNTAKGQYFQLKNGNKYYVDGTNLKPLEGGQYVNLSRQEFKILQELNTNGEFSLGIENMLKYKQVTEEQVAKVLGIYKLIKR